jgi:hypothetical protein
MDDDLKSFITDENDISLNRKDSNLTKNDLRSQFSSGEMSVASENVVDEEDSEMEREETVTQSSGIPTECSQAQHVFVSNVKPNKVFLKAFKDFSNYFEP